MTLTPKPDTASIRAYRDTNECGGDEARTAVMKQWRRDQLNRIRTRIEVRQGTSAEEATGYLHDLVCLLLEFDR